MTSLMDGIRANQEKSQLLFLCEAVANQAHLLSMIHEELVLIRKATEQANEEEVDGPSHLGDLSYPFTPGATLNGP